MIIMNERQYIDSISKEEFCNKTRYNTSILIKRFYEETDNKKEIVQKVLDYMDNVVDNFMEEKWIKFIENTVDKLENDKLNCVDSIWVTDKEIDIVRTLDTRNEKYLLFTLIVLAKFRNMVNSDNNNWVTYSTSDIFKASGLYVTKNVQDLTIRELMGRGLISYAKKNDNLNLRVMCLLDGEEVVEVKELAKVGNIFYEYERELNNYIRCEKCGKMFKLKSNSNKYCKGCAYENHKQIDKLYQENKRKIKKID